MCRCAFEKEEEKEKEMEMWLLKKWKLIKIRENDLGMSAIVCSNRTG